MKRFFVLILGLVFCGFSTEIQLRYRFAAGENNVYRFSSSYRAQVVDPYKIHSLEEKMSGSVGHKVLELLDEGGALLLQKTHLEQLERNNQKVDLEEYQRDLLEYEYVAHPLEGKIKVKGNPDYSAQDAMEMVLSFPEKSLNEGDKWPVTYVYKMAMAGGGPIDVPGFYLLKSVKGDMAEIEGRFRARIEESEDLQFRGEVTFIHRFRFNWKKGCLDSGLMSKTLRLYSVSRLAKKYYEDTKGTDEPLRLGYEIDFSSNIRKMR